MILGSESIELERPSGPKAILLFSGSAKSSAINGDS